MEHDEATRRQQSEPSAGLGPLPPPYGFLLCDSAGNAMEAPGFSAGQMTAYAAQAVAAERERLCAAIDGLRGQAARDATEVRWAMREQIAAWLESNGQPGYAMEIRCREWA